MAELRVPWIFPQGWPFPPHCLPGMVQGVPTSWGLQPWYLDVLVQQCFGEALQGDAHVLWEATTAVQQGDQGCVPGESFGVVVPECFEVVVDGMADHDLPSKDPQHLQTREGVETPSSAFHAPREVSAPQEWGQPHGAELWG